ncbi:putative secreted protein with PEP-CTERM sorting signal [Prosthecobacter fusiformis]|uniref:Putative secreted protein with PEP-CTERM sorting signal n=1 Tax=Prosthecobacter fusiformis TaxID=48464 RepID=A0A4V3FIA0_9BACT|nr:PEP-CTERM sorting domain-containing protein [Prosthecobacter fusiformis]TDU81563.1 putative secreted protein with PEP-CTERM sorting signal [Prosthecobacter fusiformis]
MRKFFYWLTSLAIAVLAAGASEQGDDAAEILWTPASQLNALPVPEPSRAVLLGIGIMAIAFTYRKAWINLKRKD